MVSLRQTWINFIEMALKTLPNYISQYPPYERVWLERFMDIMKGYRAETTAARTKFITEYRELYSKLFKQEVYLQTPFLWFMVSYLKRAAQKLDVAQFHADEYYEYLAHYLRGKGEKKGVFRLIQEKTPLKDLMWEDLQYECTKMTVPLSLEEVQVQGAILSFIKEAGIYGLNPRSLRAAIVKKIKTPGLSRKLPRLFERLNARWELVFFPEFLGRKKVFFRIKVQKSTSLSEIIDFTDPKNHVLNLSRVYRVRGTDNIYTGYLDVPTGQEKALYNYFKTCEAKGLVEIYDWMETTNKLFTQSFTQYTPNQGWHEWTLLEYDQLSEMLRTTRPQMTRKTDDSLFYNTKYVSDTGTVLHYKELDDPLETIKLFTSRGFLHYAFDTLLPSMSTEEQELLKRLFKYQVVTVHYYSTNLWHDYSLEYYLMKFPHIPMEQLERLLITLPMSLISKSENETMVYAHLTSPLARGLAREMKWTVLPLTMYHDPELPSLQDYDVEGLEWKTPQVLKEYTE